MNLKTCAALALAWTMAACGGRAGSAPTASAVRDPPVASGSASEPVPAGPQVPLGGWIHFREHDQGDVLELVPEGTHVPPSMFREFFTLESGGVAKKLCPSPSDAHQVFPGTWKQTGSTLEIEVACFGNKQVERYTVVEVTPTVLRLRILR